MRSNGWGRPRWEWWPPAGLCPRGLAVPLRAKYSLVLLCYKTSQAPSITKRAGGELLGKMSGNLNSEGRDGMRIVTFNTHAASRGGGTQAEVSWRVSPVDRRLRRGKNDFFPRRGSRKRRCITWRDGENLASPDLRNVPVPTLASALGSRVR